MKPYFRATREIIPHMLSLFAEHEIHVTWATVGLLFHETREELLQQMPSQRPAYLAPISAYDYIEKTGIGENEEEDPYHFAPSLIRLITGNAYQEIATHSYSHYYCNEAGQTLEDFRQDLRTAQSVAGKFGIKLESLVFPRNQFNNKYLRICRKEGIIAVRSNPADWFWNIESTERERLYTRLVRGADAFFPIGKRTSFPSWKMYGCQPVQIPASRLLRPYSSRESLLNGLKLKRIAREMQNAAESGENYHLWWHPHNFGNSPARNLEDLELILHFYKKLHRQTGFRSLTMNEMAKEILHGKA